MNHTSKIYVFLNLYIAILLGNCFLTDNHLIATQSNSFNVLNHINQKKNLLNGKSVSSIFSYSSKSSSNNNEPNVLSNINKTLLSFFYKRNNNPNSKSIIQNYKSIQKSLYLNSAITYRIFYFTDTLNGYSNSTPLYNNTLREFCMLFIIKTKFTTISAYRNFISNCYYKKTKGVLVQKKKESDILHISKNSTIKTLQINNAHRTSAPFPSYVRTKRIKYESLFLDYFITYPSDYFSWTLNKILNFYNKFFTYFISVVP